MAKQTINVPDLGGGEKVEVIEICVAVGDRVEIDDSLLVLESDKASMEIPSPVAGVVVEIKTTLGDKLSEGDLAFVVEVEGDVAGETEAAAEASAPEVKPAPVAEPEVVAEPPAVSAAATTEIVAIPDIGGADDVDVIEVCVAVGDDIAEGDSLVVLETDKASMEVPSPYSGTVTAVSVKEGGKVSEGSVLVEMSVLGAVAVASTEVADTEKPAPATAAESTAPVISAPAAVTDTKAPLPSTSGNVYAGPAVRKLARELGVDLEKVSGSGPRGRVVKEDVQAFVKTAMQGGAAGTASAAVAGAGIPPVPVIDFAKFGEIEIQPLTKIDKLTAANMQRNWLNVPHVTQFDDADITELEDFRASLKKEAEQRGVKITPLPFILKACAAALKAHPKFNASLQGDGEHIVYKKYVHIGIAVDTPVGLLVPVIRDVDKKSIWELAAEAPEMAQKAKQRKLKLNEMQGGCFTISSLGNIGGTGFTPIISAPEVAILGVSKLAVKPVWNGSEFEPRKMLPLSLSYDHRVINGADAGRFFTYLGQMLADIRRLAL